MLRWLLPLALLASCKDKDTGDPNETEDDSGDTDDTGDTPPGDERLRVTILHTNDWQSHMLGWGPNAEYTPDTTGDDGTVGGMARLKTLVEEIRASSDHPVVLYDAGDWMAGDLFQLLATSHAAELQMAQAVGYDAIILGNHEFDWGPAVLGEMISRGDAAGVAVPILASNTHPNTSDSGDDPLEAHFDSGRVQESMVQTLDNGLTIGLFGLIGDEAQSITPAVSPATFSPADEAGAEMATMLADQGVDLVVAITHSGVTDDPATSPDHQLAAAAPEIDVIVGGHSHTPLPQYLTADDGTIILQAGAYTRYLGQLDLVLDPDEGWMVEGYTLHELDDTIPGDPAITEMVDGFLTALEEGPLQAMGYDFAEPIAHIDGDIETPGCGESGLGDLITDAYRWKLSALSPEDPIDVAFESQGVIRDNLVAGSTGIQAFSDMFRVLPLGFGGDEIEGYPLVHFYVTPKELKGACEVTASISPSYGCNYFIEVSGARCILDMSESSFNRVDEVEIWDGEQWVELDTSSGNTELYHVAVDSYVASLMNILGGLTYNSISITPKDALGVPYADVAVDARFDEDPDAEGVQEVKLWEALIDYSRSFPDTDGDDLPDIPADYSGPDDRIVGYE